MDIISKRTGNVIVDGTSMRLTLSNELIDLGCEKDKIVSVMIVKNGSNKQIIIEKV